MSESGWQGQGRSLLAGMFTVGVIGFGGGSALIPVIEAQLVEGRQLLDAETYTRDTVVANLTPGALPVKLGAAAGFHLGSTALSLGAALAVGVPGMVATLGLIALSGLLGDRGVALISQASVGINAFIIVLLLGYIAKVLRAAGRRRRLFWIILIVTALLNGTSGLIALIGRLLGQQWHVAVPKLSAVQVIVLALVTIAVTALIANRRGERPAASVPGSNDAVRASLRTAGSFVLLLGAGIALMTAALGRDGLAFGATVALSTVTSFGGGEAYVAVADGFFVQTGMVGSSPFYTQLIPIANALPGPILVSVAAGISYYIGLEVGTWQAWLAGLAALLITAGACCAVAMVVLGAYEWLRDNAVFVAISTYVLPVICGLLITTSVTMLEVSSQIAADGGLSRTGVLWASVVAIAVMYVLHRRHLVKDLVMLFAAGAVAALGFQLLG